MLRCLLALAACAALARPAACQPPPPAPNVAVGGFIDLDPDAPPGLPGYVVGILVDATNLPPGGYLNVEVFDENTGTWRPAAMPNGGTTSGPLGTGTYQIWWYTVPANSQWALDIYAGRSPGASVSAGVWWFDPDDAVVGNAEVTYPWFVEDLWAIGGGG